MWAGVIWLGLPSTTSKPTFISGIGLERLDQRVADEVGERHLAAAGAGEVVVDDDAVVPEQLDRHRPDRGRGRHAERVVHVGDGAGGRAAQHGVRRLVARRRPGRACGFSLGTGRSVPLAGSAALLSGRGVARGWGGALVAARPGSPRALLSVTVWRRPASPRPRRRERSAPSPCRSAEGDAPLADAPLPVRLEVRRPGRVDAPRITLELFVHLLDEPLVGSEVGGGSGWEVGSDGLVCCAARVASPLPDTCAWCRDALSRLVPHASKYRSTVARWCKV